MTESLLGGQPVTTVAESIDFVKMLVYGQPGVGKTYLAGTSYAVSNMQPSLYIDVEGGSKTIRKLAPNMARVEIQDTIDSKGKVVSAAWENLSKVYEDLRRENAYGTVIIDNLTEAHKLCMDYTLSSQVGKAASRGREKDEDVPEQRDWGIASTMFRRMIRSFRDLDAHVIFTAHEAEIKDAKTGAVTLLPSIPGKLSREVPGYMDEVFYLYTKEKSDEGETVVERKLLSQPTGKFFAKDRSGAMPTVMTDPTMALIAERVID